LVAARIVLDLDTHEQKLLTTKPDAHLSRICQLMNLAQRIAYAPFLVQVVVTRRCNLSCTYCDEFDQISPPVPTDLLKSRIDKIRQLGAWAIEWSGGEPLLHPDLCELTRYAKEQGFTRVMLLSNGFLLDPDKIVALNLAGLDDLQVSVDGVLPNQSTVKVLKPLRAKLEALARVAKFRVTLNAVIGSAPAEEAIEVIAFAREQGFRPRVCLIHDHDGQIKLGADDTRVYQQIRRQVGRAFHESAEYRTRLMRDGRAPFKCRAGSRYLYVDEDGSVHWCSQQRGAFAVPLDEYTPHHLKEQFYTPKSCAEHCTVGCVRSCSRADQWRWQRAIGE
jgi:MoaA/NifB/PqqE/SkfB family radical SAM enzyme